VTIDGLTHQVPSPFMVLATQNPVDYLGTFALPEAQLDRFFMKISLGYPDETAESKMLERFKGRNPLDTLTPVAEGEHIIQLQELTEQIHVDPEINKFILSITRHTREHSDVQLGASPRASLCLYRASQAWAMYEGRDYVIPDDVMEMTPHVLSHRILLRQEANLRKVTVDSVLEMVIDQAASSIIPRR